MRARSLFLLAALASLPSLAVADDIATPMHPDQLVILSRTDVHGMTEPCGCHVPKGGLARQQAFVDSMRSSFGRVLLVDNGGFCPDLRSPFASDAASFQMDCLHEWNTDAVGLGESDVSLGIDWLIDEAKRRDLPMVCANLVDAHTSEPVFATGRLVRVGELEVGVLGLLSPSANLGDSRDRVQVIDPVGAARKAVASLRRDGATIVVLLSQMSRSESDQVASAVSGIDVMIVGHGAPLHWEASLTGGPFLLSGGDSGHFMGKLVLATDRTGAPTAATGEVLALGPDIRDDPAMQSRVKLFEERQSERARAGSTDRSTPDR